MPRNTLKDYVGLCKLKIIDQDKYKTVVQQEVEKKGKAVVNSTPPLANSISLFEINTGDQNTIDKQRPNGTDFNL